MTGCSKVPGVFAPVKELVPAAARHDNTGKPYLSNPVTNQHGNSAMKRKCAKKEERA